MDWWLATYVVVMIYFMLGCGFRFPEIAKWRTETITRISVWTHLWGAVKAMVTWPWFNIDRLREKYSTTKGDAQ